MSRYHAPLYCLTVLLGVEGGGGGRGDTFRSRNVCTFDRNVSLLEDILPWFKDVMGITRSIWVTAGLIAPESKFDSIPSQAGYLLYFLFRGFFGPKYLHYFVVILNNSTYNEWLLGPARKGST